MYRSYEVIMEEVELYDFLKKIKKFEDRSNAKFKEQWDRIKSDKEFLWSKPLSDDVNRLIGTKRYRGHVDVVSNCIRSIVNSYTSYPFKPRVQNPDLAEFYNKLNDDISESVEGAFKNAVSFGLGFIAVLPTEVNGVIVPKPYSIDKVENVYYDPDSTDMDGKDANEVLIVDYKSKSYIKQMYGEEIANKFTNGTELALSTTCKLESDKGAIFTYFKKEGDFITIYKFVADTLVEEPIQLQLKQIPVLPVYGEAIEVNDKRVFRGIVSQCKVIQDLADMSASQLMERLAKSPKNIWLATRRTIGKNSNYFEQSDTNTNQLLIWDDKDGQNPNPPQRIEQTVEYSDLTGIMNNTIGLMQSVVGVQSVGLPDEKNEITATEVLLNAKTYNNNIRHFMAHLKYSFKALCELLADYVMVQDKITIENGPQENIERQAARQELMALTNLLQDPTDKKRAVVAIATTMNDNTFVAPFLQAISQEDPALTLLKQQATQMQQGYEQQINDLKNQIQLLKAQAISLDARNKDSLRKAELDNQTKIVIEQMKQQGLDGRQAKEQVHDDIEQARKEQAEDNRAKLEAINKVTGGEL